MDGIMVESDTRFQMLSADFRLSFCSAQLPEDKWMNAVVTDEEEKWRKSMGNAWDGFADDNCYLLADEWDADYCFGYCLRNAYEKDGYIYGDCYWKWNWISCVNRRIMCGNRYLYPRCCSLIFFLCFFIKCIPTTLHC